MLIHHEFDEANAERRERLYNNNLRTADKLAERINHFFQNTDKNCSLTNGQKNIIKSRLLEQIK